MKTLKKSLGALRAPSRGSPLKKYKFGNNISSGNWQNLPRAEAEAQNPPTYFRERPVGEPSISMSRDDGPKGGISIAVMLGVLRISGPKGGYFLWAGKVSGLKSAAPKAPREFVGV